MDEKDEEGDEMRCKGEKEREGGMGENRRFM